ncbi:MAG: UDP-N-acetylmuramate--L-alanine ligase [Clostridia bacterium]|nr:UDP-N-acetylmuramate--L-alanine ligase [Clostridia bacterium]
MAQKSAREEKSLSFEKLRSMTENSTGAIHFVGVGGVSMYSLARVALHLGASVSGSDRESSERTRALSLLGARIIIGHAAENVSGASLVVYNNAIAEDNPELVRARELMIPTVTRAEYMAAMMIGHENRIGVSGSHGKSTTVAMLDAIFSYAGVDPSVLSGSELPIGEPLKIGGNSLMLYEACEYKDSFLKFTPTVAIGLNLELDHTDYFGSISDIKDSFKQALGRASKFSVINGDDENFRPILKQIKGRVITFGKGSSCDYRYSIISFKEQGFEFTVSKFGNEIGRFRLNIPGAFNVSSATAAIVTALEYGIDVDTVREGIGRYFGIPRRLERVGLRYTRQVYYDYAHHPTEIAASINAVKMLTHDLVTVIFKPHTYSRTATLWDDMKASLSLADHVILMPIYPAREEKIEGITSERLAYEIGSRAKFSDDDDFLRHLDLHTHGTIIVMGAGDMENIKKDVLNKYI